VPPFIHLSPAGDPLPSAPAPAANYDDVTRKRSHLVTPDHRPSVVVVGSGLSGLAAADALARAGWAVTILGPADRVGGVVDTIHQDGWLIERSADCFLASRPEVVPLAERLGISAELVGVQPAARRALVWHAGRLLPVPKGFRLLAPGRTWPLLMSPILTVSGKCRVLGERFVAPGRAAAEADESLESFAVRRLGREAFEKLVQPLAAGIWTADPARLSMAAACADFLALEREAGSLWAGERARLRAQPAAAEAAGARYGQFLSFASGMGRLPQRLADELQRSGVRFVPTLATSVGRSTAGRWDVAVSGAAAPLSADAVVVATPADVSARLLTALDEQLGAELAAIEYAGSCIVSLGFARERVSHPLAAAGLVIPRSAHRRILAVSFASSKFPGRAPPGCVLLRVFVGGALDPDVMRLADAEMTDLAVSEVRLLLGARGDPQLAHVERWQGAMPQYHVGHGPRVARIAAAVARHPGLALAGAAYTGVGIPQVIASGQAAAARITGRSPGDPAG